MSSLVVPARRADAPALRPQPKRDGPDHWPTPPCLCDALARHVLPRLPSGPIWEPAAGSGVLVRTLWRSGRIVLQSDLQNDGTDFLSAAPPAAPLASIITNPPFRLLDEFSARGLSLLDRGATLSLVLLWRWDHFTACSRGAVIRRAAEIRLCQWRPRWIADSTVGPRWSFAWVVWRAGHCGPPRLFPEQQQRPKP